MIFALNLIVLQKIIVDHSSTIEIKQALNTDMGLMWFELPSEKKKHRLIIYMNSLFF